MNFNIRNNRIKWIFYFRKWWIIRWLVWNHFLQYVIMYLSYEWILLFIPASCYQFYILRCINVLYYKFEHESKQRLKIDVDSPYSKLQNDPKIRDASNMLQDHQPPPILEDASGQIE